MGFIRRTPCPRRSRGGIGPRGLLATIPLGSFLAVVLLAAPVTAPPSPPNVSVEAVGLTGPTETARPGWGRQIDVDANLVGVEWHGDDDARFTLEARKGDRWERVGEIEAPDPSEGPDPGSRDARRASRATVSEPIWVGDTSAVRVRLADGEARDVTLHAVDSPPERASGNVAGALAPQPAIITRAQWGADEGLRQRACPEGPEYAPDVEFAVVHHSAGGNSYSPSQSASLVRGVYAYHVQANGWCDVGYNFLVDRYGQVFEGRYGGITRPVIGAHAQGFNTGSTGVAVLGNFVSTTPPAAVTTALVKLLAWKLQRHGVAPGGWVAYRTAGSNRYPAGTVVTMPTIVGHIDVNQTECPGGRLHALLPSIRSGAAARVAAYPDPPSGRAVAANPNGGYYLLAGDGQVTARDGAPSFGSPRWPYQDLARDIAVMPDGAGYAVLDAWGGVHRFGSARNLPGGTSYWRGWDIARRIAIAPDGRGYAVLDGWGGVHGVGVTVPRGLPYWRGWDIARGLAFTPTGGAYVLDGWGGVHAAGGAPQFAGPYWRGWDIARDIAASPSGSGYAVLDGFGGIHVRGSSGVRAASGGYVRADLWRGLAASANGYLAVRADGLVITP